MTTEANRKEAMKMRQSSYRWLLLATVMVALMTACEKREKGEETSPGPPGSRAVSVPSGDAGEAGAFVLTSPAFTNGEAIPREFTCDGRNVSPALAWHNPPKDAAAFALIMDDPDAPRGTFTHWVIFNIPATENRLPAELPATERLKSGALQGSNSAQETGYMGPCPPSGTHRYFFRLYALHKKLDVKAGADRATVENAMKEHILGTAELMGTYGR
jgi:Raf kinase inhibitor-like YbhB/YbcL family protein